MQWQYKNNTWTNLYHSFSTHWSTNTYKFINIHPDLFKMAISEDIGAKLAVAPVARATPLFLPRPEIIYINVVHYSAPPRTYLLRATPLFRPLWRHCVYLNHQMKKPINNLMMSPSFQNYNWKSIFTLELTLYLGFARSRTSVWLLASNG